MTISVFDYQMWDALLKVECSVQDISSQWRLRLEKDLKKRICKVQDDLFISLKEKAVFYCSFLIVKKSYEMTISL